MPSRVIAATAVIGVLILGPSLASAQSTYIPAALSASGRSEAEVRAMLAAGRRYQQQSTRAEANARRAAVRADAAERVVAAVAAQVFKDQPSASLSELIPTLERRLEEYDRLVAEAAHLREDFPDAVLRPQVERIQSALNEGRLSDARALIEEMKGLVERIVAAGSPVYETSARLALVEGRYAAAADDYFRAADLTPRSSVDERSRLESLGRLQQFQAELDKKSPAELQAFLAFSEPLARTLYGSSSLDANKEELLWQALWVTGVVYDRLSETVSLTYSLGAETVYRQMLELPKLSTRDRAVIQLQLGRVLQISANRGSADSEAALQRCREAYQAAAAAFSAQADPTYFLSAQHGLIAVLIEQGTRETERSARREAFRSASRQATSMLDADRGFADDGAVEQLRDLRAVAQLKLADAGDPSELASGWSYYRERMSQIDRATDHAQWYRISIKLAGAERTASAFAPQQLAAAIRRLETTRAEADRTKIGDFDWAWLHLELGRSYWFQARRTGAGADFDRAIAAYEIARASYEAGGSVEPLRYVAEFVSTLREEKRRARRG